MCSRKVALIYWNVLCIFLHGYLNVIVIKQIQWKLTEKMLFQEICTSYENLMKREHWKRLGFTAFTAFKTKKELHHCLTTLKAFNAEKGLRHFLTTLKVFNTEKRQHYCLKVFNTEKRLHHLLRTLKVFNIVKRLHHFLETLKGFNFKKWLHHILLTPKKFFKIVIL